MITKIIRAALMALLAVQALLVYGVYKLLRWLERFRNA